MKNKYKKLCKLLGCSGVDKKCPGNPECAILRKIIKYGEKAVNETIR